jgi:tRNA threonylcarbamoyladenosine biosynthesis protein TsaB
MEKYKTILTLDTAMGGCSAAVLHEGGVAVRSEFMPRGQSEVLMPLICEVVGEAGVGFDEVDAIVTTLGPGAFTGLRMGMSCAKALALSLGVPIYGVSTLQALAFAVVADGAVDEGFKVLVDTRREDFYVQDFDMQGMALNEIALQSYVDVLSGDSSVINVVGDVTDAFMEQAGVRACVIAENTYPDPVAMARGLIACPDVYTEAIEPIYLRGIDIGQSKKTYRKLS